MVKRSEKFMILLWKNWIILKRHPFQCFLELLIPILICCIPVIWRSFTESPHMKGIQHPEFDPIFNNTEIKEIAYSPNNDIIRNHIMGKFINIYTLTPRDDAKELEKYLTQYEDKLNTGKMAIGVVFNIDRSAKVLPYSINFKLRFPSDLEIKNWKTSLLFPEMESVGPREPKEKTTASPGYYSTGFLGVQKTISMQIINYVSSHNMNITNSSRQLPEVVMQRYPYPAYDEDWLMIYISKYIGILIVAAFSYPLMNTVRVIVVEEEKQLKEYMKIMGLPVWMHRTGWFIKSLIFLTIPIICIVILFKVKAWYKNGIPAVFPKTNFLLLFIFLFIYTFSIITLCFLFSVCFRKAHLASLWSLNIFIFTSLPFLILEPNYDSLGLIVKLSTSMVSNIAISFGFKIICMFEIVGEGLQWDNLWKPVTNKDSLCMGYILCILVFDVLLYLVIALYIEAVFPGEYGVAKPWNFIFFTNTKGNKVASIVTEDKVNIFDLSSFEIEPTHLKAGISILHLRKAFSKNKVAVYDLSLNMYESQITVLLGHNGAGKTCTMSMLSGTLPVTSGTAIINGYDLTKDIGRIRSILGLCPQNNILFDELTVTEHIYFYSKLKGMERKRIQSQIDNFLKLLQFEDKRNAKSTTLSGGMKRKLSVAIALCGNSKIIMLDEPTSGMDPYARRSLWELVESQKKGRTILLTTHFMDEADLLGDRIAIMAGGELQCCGTSFFLKNKYGAGYCLIIERKTGFDVQRVTDLIQTHIPKIKVEKNIGTELVYLLGKEDSPVFKSLLKDIETNSRSLGIKNFGISLTTLEEVFMRVGAGADQRQEIGNNDESKENYYATDLEFPTEDNKLLTGNKLIISQLRAMFMKRFLYELRNYSSWLYIIIIPVMSILFAMFLSGTFKTDFRNLDLDITLNSYDTPVTLISSPDGQNDYYKSMAKLLLKQSHKILDIEQKLINSTILKLTSKDPLKVSLNYIVGATFTNSQIVAWFNNNPYHSPPLALNLVANSILKTINESYEINVGNEPLPSTSRIRFQSHILDSLLGINIGIIMAIMSGFWIVFYIKERIVKMKHLQLVSGVDIFIFWFVSFLWDTITFIILVIIIFITIVCFQRSGLKTVSDMGRLSIVFVYFGFSFLPCIYMASFISNSPSLGQNIISLFLLIGPTMYFAATFLSYKVANILDWILIPIPTYSLTGSIVSLCNEFNRYDKCKNAVDQCTGKTASSTEDCWKRACIYLSRQCCRKEENYFGWEKPGILRYIIYTLIIGIILLIILALKEYNILTTIGYALQEKRLENIDLLDDNDDVIEENRRIRNLTSIEVKKEMLVVRNITKYYGKFLAVNGICLGVNRYECFGLLGVNGAGKTTTFQMITGDTHISYGNVFVDGFNLKKKMKKVHKLIGYCPQFDALLDDLTAEETMQIFCWIRGVPSKQCDYEIKKIAQEFDFYKYLDQKVKNLSGGNKRKLSTAIAFIGNPLLVYLDEPTTGMDVASKRLVWNALCSYRDSGMCLVLTSHSMDECEALCTRLAIMINGRFKCLGSVQHLKSQFSKGYTLTIKLKKEDQYIRQSSSSSRFVDIFIKNSFPSAELRDRHQELLTYYISDISVPVSKMFGIMETAKTSLDIEDYSLGQSSLLQVFLNMTKLQQE